MAILQFDDRLSSSHSHSTKFDDRISELADILASVIQGSAIGPVPFIVTASDLQSVHTVTGNVLAVSQVC